MNVWTSFLWELNKTVYMYIFVKLLIKKYMLYMTFLNTWTQCLKENACEQKVHWKVLPQQYKISIYKLVFSDNGHNNARYIYQKQLPHVVRHVYV